MSWQIIGTSTAGVPSTEDGQRGCGVHMFWNLDERLRVACSDIDSKKAAVAVDADYVVFFTSMEKQDGMTT